MPPWRMKAEGACLFGAAQTLRYRSLSVVGGATQVGCCTSVFDKVQSEPPHSGEPTRLFRDGSGQTAPVTPMFGS
jgi:hypothetical protein